MLLEVGVSRRILYSIVSNLYPFLLVCPNLRQIRTKHISFIWYTYPSVDKFIQLCTSKNKRIINNISRYIFNAMKFRKQNLSIE